MARKTPTYAPGVERPADPRVERYRAAQEEHHEAQLDEFNEALDVAERGGLIQPTPEEARNGWTPEALTAYVAEQRAAQELRADPHSLFRRGARKPMKANSKYSPLRWRG